VGCRVTKSGDLVALTGPLHHQTVVFDRSARDRFRHEIVQSRGWGDTKGGGGTAEVTESLDDYTTFASLPKILIEVFLKVDINFMGLDKAAL
jgi:hypothetical protein